MNKRLDWSDFLQILEIILLMSMFTTTESFFQCTSTGGKCHANSECCSNNCETIYAKACFCSEVGQYCQQNKDCCPDYQKKDYEWTVLKCEQNRCVCDTQGKHCTSDHDCCLGKSQCVYNKCLA